jgi:hypothetical protein
MATYTLDPTTGTYVLSDDQSFSVTTDQPDYAPGSTATFTANVVAGDTITFDVIDVAGTAVSGTNQPWTVTDGGAGDLDGVANGVIQTSWAVGQDAAGEAFVVSATDQAAGLMATASFTDSNPHIPVDAIPALQNGTIFLTGDTNTSTGTGIFPSFVQIQNTGTEEGFNTDYRPAVEDTDSSPVHNHSITLGTIPIVNIGGIDYREFRLDLNEQDKPITLESLQIYKAGVGNLPDLSTASLLYNMDGNGDVAVDLTAWSSGSGHSDYKVLIPNSYFSGSADGDFIYLYSKFSGADAGFEEWSLGPASPTPPGSTPDAVVGIDKQISVDGVTWLDQGLYGTVEGSHDAPTLLAGSTVYYQVLLTNDTTPNASDPDPLMTLTSLLDANGPVLTAKVDGSGNNVGDTNHDGKWDVGETWVYTGSTTAVNGLQIDTATANVTVTDLAGTTSGTNTDQANYIGVTPTITIEKDVSVDGGLTWSDANSATGPTLLSGFASPMFQYKVTNTGNVDLAAPTVTDNTGLTLVYQSGDTGGDNVFGVGEIWTYAATGTWAAGQNTNIGEAKDSFTDSANHTANLDVTDPANYFGLAPSINVEKLVSVDGGTNWYFTVSAGDTYDDVAYISSVTGIDSSHLHTGTPSTLAAASIQFEFVVTNTGNVDLSNIVLHDVNNATNTAVDLNGAAAGTDITIGSLAANGPAYITTLTTTAALGISNTDTATVTADTITDSANNHVTPTDSDSASYTGTFIEQGGTLTQGFWGSHTDAWDGTSGHESNPTKSAYNSGVLASLDINPRHDGNLLLGDTNHNGIADDAHDLLISDKLAAAIESSSTSGDARIIMLQQAIAAQLNIDNGKAEPNDLIDEAVMWLTKQGAWSSVGVNVASSTLVDDGYGHLTLAVAENASHTALLGSSVATSSAAWHSYVDVTDPSSGITDWNGGQEADGEGLKNALMWWNDGHLVTSAASQVAYDTNGTAAGGINPATVNLNTLDEFWLTLHQQAGLTGIA